MRGGKRALVITPSKALFYNFCKQCDAGGDIFTLVRMVKGVDQLEAAKLLTEHFLSTPKPATHSAFDPMKYSEKLDYEHAAVKEYGLTPERARQLGIGWSTKGFNHNRLAIPIREPDGTIIGWWGYNPELTPPMKIPKL